MTVNNNKEVTRGDSGLFSVTLYDKEGAEYVPAEGETLTFYLLKKECDDITEAILTKDIPVGTMQLELTPQETASLQKGSYPYRIRIIDLFGHEWTVVKSKLNIIC